MCRSHPISAVPSNEVCAQTCRIPSGPRVMNRCKPHSSSESSRGASRQEREARYCRVNLAKCSGFKPGPTICSPRTHANARIELRLLRLRGMWRPASTLAVIGRERIKARAKALVPTHLTCFRAERNDFRILLSLCLSSKSKRGFLTAAGKGLIDTFANTYT